MFHRVPFVERDDEGAAFLQHLVGDAKVLRLKAARGIEQKHDDFGEVHSVQAVRNGELFELVLHFGALAHAGRVDQADGAGVGFLIARVGPFPVDRDRVTGDARFRAGQQAVFAQQPVDECRFARIGTADDGELKRSGL